MAVLEMRGERERDECWTKVERRGTHTQTMPTHTHTRERERGGRERN